jgi:mRNA-degrading endonuclease RelE of RelBE toxin-antitoxin system
MYCINVAKNVNRFIENLPNSQIIKNKINELKYFKSNIRLHLDIKKMKSQKKNIDLFRLRIGEIRIIFQLFNEEKIIFVKLADYRGRVYS